MSEQKVGEYQLLDHGIDHAQYFPGCGISLTPFNHVATGCGSNFAEAIEDALDSIAQDGFDADRLEAIIKADENVDSWPTEPNTDQYHEENEMSEMYYYVSIRWNAAQEEGN